MNLQAIESFRATFVAFCQSTVQDSGQGGGGGMVVNAQYHQIDKIENKANKSNLGSPAP